MSSHVQHTFVQRSVDKFNCNQEENLHKSLLLCFFPALLMELNYLLSFIIRSLHLSFAFLSYNCFPQQRHHSKAREMRGAWHSKKPGQMRVTVLHIAPLTWAGFKRQQAQDYSGLDSVTSLPGVSQIQETDSAVSLKQKRLVISFLPTAALSFVSFLDLWVALNEKWISLCQCCVQQTVLFCTPSLPQVWRERVVGADSSRTESPIIVRLRVTSTPQWQQLLINPTSQSQAPPCPLVASLQSFPLLHLCLCF